MIPSSRSRYVTARSLVLLLLAGIVVYAAGMLVALLAHEHSMIAVALRIVALALFAVAAIQKRSMTAWIPSPGHG